SELTPLSGQRYAELFAAAGLPPGVLNLVQGGAEIGAALATDRQIPGVIFTGSYETGRRLRQATFDMPEKKLCLELGGKNPAVVLDDADLAQTTREILLGALLTAGQRCTATSRVIVTQGIAAKLRRRLSETFRQLRPSDPCAEDCLFGPLASEAARARFLKLLERGRSEGAIALVESDALPGGAFVTPSLYEVSGDEAYLMEELFGPHVAFQVVRDEAAAFAAAAAKPYGLSASLFSASREAFERFYDQVPAGVLNWNRSTNGASGMLPFGGIGKSGNWQPAGSEGARLSTYPVAVMEVPFGAKSPNSALDAQLDRDPLEALERQHTIEAICERVGLWPDRAGISLHLSLRGADFLVDQRPSSAEDLEELLQEVGFSRWERVDGEESVRLPFSLQGARADFERECAQLEALLEALLCLSPERALLLPKRRCEAPQGGVLPRSASYLERFYGGNFLPREKKPAVVDLGRSQGPFLRSIDDAPLQIIDAASQIASLAAGFRPDAAQRALDEGDFEPHLVTAAHPSDPLAQGSFEALEKAMRAHCEPELAYVSWVNGGAEANEKSFHIAQRATGQKKIVAFEGAFHGRMLLSLYSTWNPVKRAPYQLEGFETLFVPRPIPDDPYADPDFGAEWVESWRNRSGPRSGFGEEEDALLAAEIESLSCLESLFSVGDVSCCTIEPYQCEGGDVSPTRRYFHALRALTKAYDIPLIFDEVQSGFGLSGEALFWYTLLGLDEAPDIVCGAKRGQVGYVISRWPDPAPDAAHAASAVRGLTNVRAVTESKSFEALLRSELEGLCRRWPALVTRTRAFGDAFAFDLPSREIALHLIGQRFYQGYMVYIAGERTLRYRMNRGMREEEVQEIFQIVDRSLRALIAQAGGHGDQLIERMSAQQPLAWIDPASSTPAPPLRLSELLEVPGDADVALKRLGALSEGERRAGEAASGLSEIRGGDEAAQIAKLDAATFEAASGLSLLHFAADRLGARIRQLKVDDFDSFAEQIRALQVATYEPERRDEVSYFKALLESEGGVGLIAEDPEGLVGIAFGAPLERWVSLDGPAQDPRRGLEDTFYSADLTIAPRSRGQGVGGRLRAALIRAVLSKRWPDGRPRYRFISGRNRVGQATPMWRLNQRWGAYEVAVYHGQYNEADGAARYYRIPLRRASALRGERAGERAHPLPCHGVHLPTGWAHPELSKARARGVFDEATLTKLTVSNFITPSYARYAETLRQISPPGCPHLYFTSCASEMIDKSVRALKHKRVKAELAVSFAGADFGANSAATRSLGEEEKYFPWPTVPHPEDGLDSTLAALDAVVAQAGGPEKLLGIFCESVQRRSGKTLSAESWAALCAWRDRHQVPLILSENQTGLGRSGTGRHWWLEGVEGEADLVLWWAGGQIGHIFSSPEAFVAKPLTLISTWDGDELSALRIQHQLHAIRRAPVAARAAQLDEILTRLFPTEERAGLGLYRVVTHLKAEAIVAAVAADFTLAALSPSQLLIAPPLTCSEAELSSLESALEGALAAARG
ncbi:MAG: aldehyde dehydrogenase family protein, partial [Myxococcota bacterium]|nr:aldehyde dehydrogenase family protein [Myxococcota bacterium]